MRAADAIEYLRRRLRLAAAAVAALGLAGFGWSLRGHVLPETSPAERGARAARAFGCWDCHRGAEAPSLFDGARDPAALRAAVRDTPAHAATFRAAAPNERDVDDLAAWIAVVQLEADRAADPAFARSPLGATERLARRDCFGCHGELGQGGTRNPGSLKGYVPGFFGRDFDLLTKDGDPVVVREWIRDGTPDFFHSGVSLARLGAWFGERQEVKMPAYAGSLRPAEIDALVAYLVLLRRLGPLEAEDVAHYRTLRTLADPRPGP